MKAFILPLHKAPTYGGYYPRTEMNDDKIQFRSCYTNIFFTCYELTSSV